MQRILTVRVFPTLQICLFQINVIIFCSFCTGCVGIHPHSLHYTFSVWLCWRMTLKPDTDTWSLWNIRQFFCLEMRRHTNKYTLLLLIRMSVSAGYTRTSAHTHTVNELMIYLYLNTDMYTYGADIVVTFSVLSMLSSTSCTVDFR